MNGWVIKVSDFHTEGHRSHSVLQLWDTLKCCLVWGPVDRTGVEVAN